MALEWSGEGPLLDHRLFFFFLYPYMVEGSRELCSFSFISASIPCIWTPPSRSNLFSRAPLLIPPLLESGFQHMNFRRT